MNFNFSAVLSFVFCLCSLFFFCLFVVFFWSFGSVGWFVCWFVRLWTRLLKKFGRIIIKLVSQKIKIITFCWWSGNIRWSRCSLFGPETETSNRTEPEAAFSVMMSYCDSHLASSKTLFHQSQPSSSTLSFTPYSLGGGASSYICVIHYLRIAHLKH